MILLCVTEANGNSKYGLFSMLIWLDHPLDYLSYVDQPVFVLQEIVFVAQPALLENKWQSSLQNSGLPNIPKFPNIKNYVTFINHMDN